ncbi:MAG: GlgB N-terminal domain-containing protein, partial [bacterium]
MMELVAISKLPTVLPAEILKILHGDHSDPFAILGMHAVDLNGKSGIAVRAFLPEAQFAQVVELDKREQL